MMVEMRNYNYTNFTRLRIDHAGDFDKIVYFFEYIFEQAYLSLIA